jgi:paraquat-inducible protein A
LSATVRAADAGLCGCGICGLVSECTAEPARCPRCGGELRRRKAQSLSRSWALLVAGLLLYLPANVLPVMYTQSLQNGSAGEENTLLSGIIEFWHNGAWDIAVVIFVASILIPATKFIIMGALLLNAGRAVPLYPVLCVRLHGILESIGYWSMLDVLVVGLVTALVKFRGISDAEPRMGILYFGLVVILTMLATMAFDTRLLWRGPGARR